MSLSDLQTQYDDKIRAAVSRPAKRRLREERNAVCSPAGMLPPETLAAIFQILANNLSDSFYSRESSSIAWIAVTYVCRTWRNAALNTATLWTNFMGDPSERWQMEMLVRAKSAPLSLSMWGKATGTIQRVSEIVLESPERLKSLRVHYCGYHLELTKPTPKLEKLEISHPERLPSNFLGGYAPRLRSFVSKGVAMPTDAPWMSNLHTLHLSGKWSLTSENTQVLTSVKTLLQFLEPLPFLEELVLSLPSSLHAHPAPETVVHLPLRVWEVSVDDSYQPFKSVLDAVALHSLRNFTLHINLYGEEERLSTLREGLSFFASNTGAQGIILKWDLDNMQLTGSSGATFRLPSLWNSASRSALSACFSDIDIKRLVLNVGDRGSRHYPPLLCVGSHSVEELYLEEALELHKFVPFPYPSLRRLHLKRAGFTPKFEVLDQLKEWIRGHNKLERLILEGCQLTKADVASLGEVVPVTPINTLPY